MSRLLCGSPVNGEVARLDGDAADLARRLVGAAVEDRRRIYAEHLGRLNPDRASDLRADVLAADPRGPDPDAVATVADLARIVGDVEWEWDHWLPKGFVVLLVGETGSGKSMVALWGVCRSLLMGDPWPDGTRPAGDAAAKVLWIEAESAHQLLLERVTQARLPADRIIFPRADPLDALRLDNAIDVADLRETVRVHRPRAVVVDALSGTHDGKENSNDEMLPVIRPLSELARDFRIPVLLIHHTNKRTEGGTINQQAIRGAGAITQLPRVIWAVEKLEGVNDGWLRLRGIKRNVGRDASPIGVRIDWDGGRLEYGAAPRPDAAETPIGRASEFLEAQLRTGAKWRRDLLPKAAELGIKPRTLDRAKKEMELITLSTGEWALPSDDPEPFT